VLLLLLLLLCGVQGEPHQQRQQLQQHWPLPPQLLPPLPDLAMVWPPALQH
jgi:hypothetical protein